MAIPIRWLAVFSSLLCTTNAQTSPAKHLPAQQSFATRSGRTITLHPSEVAFDVPADWISWYREFHNNIHLSAKELQSVREGHGAEWDTEYAKVVNAVLPFRDCVAHLGGDGWGQEGSSYPAVHLRAYVTEMTEGDIKQRISTQGLSAANTMNPDASLGPRWQKTAGSG